MNKFRILSIIAIIVAFGALPRAAFAQEKSLKEKLVGTWIFISEDTIGSDGKRSPEFGSQTKGTLMLDAGGHYAGVIADSNRPKWKAGIARADRTVEELASAARGFVAQYGTWSVDEGTNTFMRKIEAALNPNNAGQEQKQTVAISGDELKLTNPNSGRTGGRTETVYRRAK